MLGRKQFKAMANAKLKEGKTLFKNGLYDGSIYLLGYVIEFSLKAKICKNLDIEDYPNFKDFKTHNFEELILLSGLKKRFDTALIKNNKLNANWMIVKDWKESLRYKPTGANQKAVCLEFIRALEEKKNGIFVWIKKHW